MKYGILAVTSPDSIWGRTARWRGSRDGRPFVFDTRAQAQEAAQAFNAQIGPFHDTCRHTAVPLKKEEAQWNIA